MKTIKSKVNDVLICSYIHKDQINEYRTDLCPDNEILQGCARKLNNTVYVAPHRHLPIKRETVGTQESWIIIEGKVLASIYDINDTFLDEIELNAGSCIVFFNGGHALRALANDTFFYEFKNGPYYGYDTDKHNI